MFLGRYDFDGDPDELLRAYDRFLAAVGLDGVWFHICIRRDGGISIYDTCPSAEVFESFSTSPDALGAMTAAGLPTPSVTPLGDAHRALAAPEYVK
jgi:hypothetical protein